METNNTTEESTETIESAEPVKSHSPSSVIAETLEVGENVSAQEPTRRSKRKSSSTIVFVNGQPIKKTNMYKVKGMSYVYEDVSASSSEKLPKKKNPTKRSVPTQKKPPVASQREIERLQRKEIVSKCIHSKSASRQKFLRDQAHILKPFLEPKVFERIASPPSAIAPPDPSDVQVQPYCIKAELRDYQLIGLDWMNRMYHKNSGMILGDEMGLGKSLQTISLIAHLKETKQIFGPCLIVCPLTVLDSWRSEIEKWAPSLKHLHLHMSMNTLLADKRNKSLPDVGKYDIVVTTYEMCKQPLLMSNVWSRQQFHLLVLDEGHIIKSSESQVSQAVRKIHCETRLILTGTPLANNLVELWSLLEFLLPDVFTTRQPFEEAFNLTLSLVDKTKLEQAHKVLDLFMLRRLKSEVEKLMPKKIETKVTCPLSRDQIWWYKALLMKDMKVLAKGEAANHQVLSNLVMQLRKTCLHPFLFPGAENIEDTSLEQLVGASGKLAVLDKLLRSLYMKDHRVVLFSQFTSMLDILEDYCIMTGWVYCRFDGSTPRAQRNFTVRSFNQPQSMKFIFLMSTRSGGMGINLQTADTCILYDSDWNPQPDIQAMARVHRIGQTKTVHVYRLITEGTIEKRIIERAEKKLYLDKVVMRDGSSSAAVDDNEDFSKTKLFSALKFGCSAVFGQGSNNNLLPSDEDIEVITDRSRTEKYSSGRLTGGADSNAHDFDVTKSFSPTTDFGGIDFGAIREQHKGTVQLDSVQDMSAVYQKRKRMNRIKMVAASGSGWGSASVPVLALNDYELETGERSVFDQELQGRSTVNTKKKKAIDFESLPHCQVCGDGGRILLCSKCPVAVHFKCCGLSSAKDFMYCSHHRCSICDKPAGSVGGMLFPCNSCPNSFCEDHLPATAKFLDSNERMEKLGFSIKRGVYVHCSPECEAYAKAEFGYREPGARKKPPCPAAVNVKMYFGEEVDTNLSAPDSLIFHG